MSTSKIEKYGKLFGDWKYKKTLYENKNGTRVLQIYRKGSDWEENCAVKVIPIIDEYGEWNNLSGEVKECYLEAKKEKCKNAEKEVRHMYAVRGCANIVSCYDYKFDDWAKEKHFGCDLLIRMELLECLRANIYTKKYSEKEILKIGIDICKALVSCHEKDITHRDIKPENIFINEFGDYLLGDFGISRIVDAAKRASTSAGTYEYMAPEQMKGGQYNSFLVDIYSLGLVLYELGNGGKLPYAKSFRITETENALRLNGKKLPAPVGIGERLAQIVLKACEYNASNRYQSASEFLQDLVRLNRETENVKNTDNIVTSLKRHNVDVLLDDYATVLADPLEEQEENTDRENVNTNCGGIGAHSAELLEKKKSIEEEPLYEVNSHKIYPELQNPYPDIESLKFAAETKNDAMAQVVLAYYYCRGIDVDKDLYLASYWAEKSALQQNAEGEFWYGYFKILGLGTDRDISGGYSWIERSSDQNNPYAHVLIGVAYDEGKPDPYYVDHNKACMMFQKAVNQGNSVAKVQLGIHFFEGTGIEQNSEKARELFLDAANAGSYSGVAWLGKCYIEGAGGSQDINKGVELLKDALENGEVEAALMLGDYFDSINDYKSAVAYYVYAAMKCNGEGQKKLAVYYYKGKYVKKDFAVAVYWFNKAFEKGSIERCDPDYRKARLKTKIYKSKPVTDLDIKLLNKKYLQNL